MYTHLEIVVVKASEEKKMKKAAVECLLSGVSLRFSVHHVRIQLSVVERIRAKEPLDVRCFNYLPLIVCFTETRAVSYPCLQAHGDSPYCVNKRTPQRPDRAQRKHGLVSMAALMKISLIQRTSCRKKITNLSPFKKICCGLMRLPAEYMPDRI